VSIFWDELFILNIFVVSMISEEELK
jgi:hypothetical protein